MGVFILICILLGILFIIVCTKCISKLKTSLRYKPILNLKKQFKNIKVLPISKECSICLEKIDKIAVKCCQCGHCFHKKCLDYWLQQNDTCPLCRGKCINF